MIKKWTNCFGGVHSSASDKNSDNQLDIAMVHSLFLQQMDASALWLIISGFYNSVRAQQNDRALDGDDNAVL